MFGITSLKDIYDITSYIENVKFFLTFFFFISISFETKKKKNEFRIRAKIIIIKKK